MALENVPSDTRGFVSGILQQGYSLGYICASAANLGINGHATRSDGWKAVFWVAAGLSFGVGIVRCLFPESAQFLKARKARKAAKSQSSRMSGSESTSTSFWAETKAMLTGEWKMGIYCVILMTWFNYYSHASQDSYTTFLLVQKRLPPPSAIRASIIMTTGAFLGGTTLGYLSQTVGRRRTIILAALSSAALIPFWILPTTEPALAVGAFLLQFCVQGAWGVVPVHLTELSPRGYRALFPGITFQVGNMLAAPAAQVVNAVSERHFVTVVGEGGQRQRVEAYGPTMGVALAVIVLGIVVTAAVGPERTGREFEKEGFVGVIPEAKNRERDVERCEKEGADESERVENVELREVDGGRTEETSAGEKRADGRPAA
ncbi:hypothetical protein VTJ49DRAFT_4062 [Mycothermus thermophilus]|uniref:Major facilitator superfamily (MFS) profile domain-containing protein n=1 Tax=Humicola insolens TaxID=85995 RepID=A0ABR3V6E4_HUMIN